jgi:hypothetical protein
VLPFVFFCGLEKLALGFWLQAFGWFNIDNRQLET